MIRNVNLNEITDGKLYSSNDMAKLGCNDCSGCSACCKDMGMSLILDPYDIYNMTSNLEFSFNDLMSRGYIELNLIDGIIQPNMSMKANDNACSFLDDEDRCSIHQFRPGICRLFPLGRYYEDGSFSYVLQTGECQKENRTKVKIKKFLSINNLSEYEKYINTWHTYIRELGAQMQRLMAEGKEAQAKALNISMLNTFFIAPYSSHNFYEEFYSRMN